MRIDNIELQYAGTSNTGLRQDITYISTGSQGGTIMVADGKIYAIKTTNGGDDFYAAAAWPNDFTSMTTRAGINNMYEIPIPGETGTLRDCKANGPGAYALFDNGNLYTWGYNTYGWCGTGNTTHVYYPTLAQTGVTDVYTHPTNNSGEAFYTRLVIKKTDGKIYGTGFNENYELGLGNTTNRSSFVELAWAGTNPISVWNVGSWGGSIVVQKSDGTLAMTGYNANGQLGLGNTTTPTTATSASSNAWLNSDTTYRIEEIMLLGRWFNGAWQTGLSAMGMLLRNASGTRYVTSGNNNYGQVGDGTTTQRTVPTAPTGTWNTIKQATHKGGGWGTIFVLKDDGTLWTWGGNNSSLQGTGNTTQQNTPGQRLTGVTNIFKGMPSTWLYSYNTTSPLFEKTDGYYMAGYNNNGDVGVGSVTNPVATFTRVLLPGNVRLKHLGEMCSTNEVTIKYAITTDNQIWAWGYNGHYAIDDGGQNVWQPIRFTPNMLQR